MQFTVARKNKETNKWEYFGEVKMSDRGYPQLELKNTAQLRAALEQAGDGRKVWCSLFEPKEKSEPVRDVNDTPLDDEIPF